MVEPKIAAIICTFNRADILARCLDSLARQNLPEQDFEVIVVDNNSSDQTQQIISTYCANFLNFKYVSEKRQGLAIARNTGVTLTNAPLVSFTDDDAEVPLDWLSRYLELSNSSKYKTAAFGGEIIPVWPDSEPDWLSEKMLHMLSAHLGWSKDARFLKDDEWLCEANTTYVRNVLLHYGGFPENLGRIGGNLLSGENIVNKLMENDGYGFFFDPEISVHHHIDPARLNLNWFKKRSFWQGVTGYYCDQYLKQNARDETRILAEQHLTLPCSADTWSEMFSENFNDDVNPSLTTLWSLGYALASQGLITG